MLRLFHVLVLVVAVFEPVQGGEEPSLPGNLIARPEFLDTDGGFGAGTAFYLQFGTSKAGYIVTAHHLFGPLGGLAEDIPPSGLKDAVTWIRMTGVQTPGIRNFRVEPLAVAQDEALTVENPFYDRHVDLAIFKIEREQGIDWGKLSDESLKTGDKVWQAAEPLAGQKSGELLHACRVLRVGRGHAFCLFENQGLVLNGTSGAPYLDDRGEVMGLHSGSLKTPGRLTAIILMAPVIRRALEASTAP